MAPGAAVVVGATRHRGIGRAVALRLAGAGHPVAVTGTGRRAPADTPSDEVDSGWQAAASVARECAAAGVASAALDLDVSDEHQVARVMDEVEERLGRIAVLVYNATFDRGPDRVPLSKLPLDTWRKVVDVNLNGAAACTQRVLRTMQEGGSVIYISSIAATQGLRNGAAYAASKAGLHALAASVALETAGAGITANVVAPGFIDTARVDALRPPERWARRTSSIPLGRAGTAEEVAGLVGYLAGPEARWLTGQVLVLDGGEGAGVNPG